MNSKIYQLTQRLMSLGATPEEIQDAVNDLLNTAPDAQANTWNAYRLNLTTDFYQL